VSSLGAVSLIGGEHLGGWNSPGSKVTWPVLICISIRATSTSAHA